MKEVGPAQALDVYSAGRSGVGLVVQVFSYEREVRWGRLRPACTQARREEREGGGTCELAPRDSDGDSSAGWAEGEDEPGDELVLFALVVSGVCGHDALLIYRVCCVYEWLRAREERVKVVVRISRGWSEGQVLDSAKKGKEGKKVDIAIYGRLYA